MKIALIVVGVLIVSALVIFIREIRNAPLMDDDYNEETNDEK